MPRKPIDLAALPQFCRQGHDTWNARTKGGRPAAGRYANGTCGECVRLGKRRRAQVTIAREVGVGLLAIVRGDTCGAGHHVAETGRTAIGGCILCHREYMRRRRRAAGARAYGAGFGSIVRGDYCARGHDVREVGRDSRGGCATCSSTYQRANARRWRARRRRPGHCSVGHLLRDVGTNAGGRCLACMTKRSRALCRRGHEKAVVGVGVRGRCVACMRLNARRQNHRRRARLGVPSGTFSTDVSCVVPAVCAICLVPFGDGARIELDHIVPVSRGGADIASNVAPAHRLCNARKHAKLLRHERVNGVWLAVLYDERGEVLWDGTRIVQRRPLAALVAWPLTSRGVA